MKKILLILAVVFITFSCTKTESVDKSVDKDINPLKVQNVVLTILDINTPESQWCKTPGGNCLPEVVIIGTRLDRFIALVANDNPNSVVEYFNGDEWKEDFSYLENDELGLSFLEKLRSGTYAITKLGSEKNTTFFKAYNIENKEEYFGLPFTVVEG